MLVEQVPAHFTDMALARLAATSPAIALANFTWLNNVTTGACHCRFSWEGDAHCLAQHRGLPFPAISVEGHDPAILRRLTAELLASEQAAYSLTPEPITTLLGQSAQVLDARREWQMLFQGDPAGLDPGDARQLLSSDLPAMLALAATDEVMVFSARSLERGAFFGVYHDDELVAMGGVQTELPGFSEIGSIVTHPRHRRQGYATQVVAALIHHLAAEGQSVFLCLFQTNHVARALYEKLGFVHINDLTLVHWQV